MRKSVISSSVSTIVALAIDCLVAAGVAVRTHLHHLNMRERLGNWQMALSQRPMQRALAFCPAYAAIASISSAQRG